MTKSTRAQYTLEFKQEEVRERCRGLWQEMLASVLQERERRPDERED